MKLVMRLAKIAGNVEIGEVDDEQLGDKAAGGGVLQQQQVATNCCTS